MIPDPPPEKRTRWQFFMELVRTAVAPLILVISAATLTINLMRHC